MSLKIDRLQLEIIIDNDQSRKQLRELEEEMNNLKQAMRKVPEGSKEWEQMNTRMKSLKVQHDKVIESIGIHGLSLKELSQRQKELNLIMRHMDPRTAEYKKLEQQLKEVTTRQVELRNGMKQTQFSMKGLADGFNKYFGIVTAGLASLTGVYLSFKKLITGAAELSDALADVRKTTGLSDVEVKQLAKDLKSIDTRSSRQELLDLARIAGKLGISGREDVLGFVRAADQISVALAKDLGGNVEEAVNQVGKLVDIFKVKNEYGLEAGLLKTGSAINALGAASSANEAYLIEFAKRMGGIANQAGISIQEILGLGATLDQLGQTSEVSSTALMALWVDMFKKPAEYADIAKMSMQDFTKLLNTDANEAFIRLLDGLNGNNAGLSAMSQKLDGLGIDGKRSVGVLATLSENTQTLREQQTLSNQEFEKGTSLTKEFNIKNETLGATLSKIFKSLGQWIVGSRLTDAISTIASGILDIVKHSGTLSEQFEQQKRKATDLQQNIKPLLDRYDELKTKAILNTGEQAELKKIIEQVGAVIPNAVTQFDKYGVAIGLNADAARKYIEDQAVYMKYINKKAIEDEENTLKTMEEKYGNMTQRMEELNKTGKLSVYVRGSQTDNQATPDEITDFRKQYAILEGDIQGSKEAIKKLNGEALKEEIEMRKEAIEVQEEDEIIQTEDEIKRQEKLLKEKQKALEDYYNGINDLSDQQYEKTLTANDRELLAIDKKYEALYALADAAGQDTGKLQEQHAAEISAKLQEQHAAEISAKLLEQDQKTAMNRFTELQKSYTSEKQARETAYLEELASLGNNEEAKKALTTKYKQDQLQFEYQHLLKLKELAETLTLDTSLLSDEDKEKYLARIEELKNALAQLKVEMVPEDDSTTTLADMLGMSDEEIETLIGKFQVITSAISESLSGINQIITNSENKQFQQFADSNEKKKKLLKQRLNAGIITQEQYNSQVEKLDEDLDKKKRKLEHDQAVRAKQMAIVQALINVAQGITAALSQMPPASYIMAAITGALGAIQIAAIASQPVPSYAIGKYDVKGMDGNTYQADYIQRARTGMYNRPTLVGGLGLVAEKAPELVVDGPTLSNIQMNAPEIIQAIHAMRVPQYATGYYPESSQSSSNVVKGVQSGDSMTALLREISAKLDNPTRAKIVWSDWDDANNEIETIKNSVSK